MVGLPGYQKLGQCHPQPADFVVVGRYSSTDLTTLLRQVRELAAYLKTRSAAHHRLALEVGHVTRVQQVGMGDR